MFLHLDMNSYFASVEQQANPHWRGKPLGVCAYLSLNGCILASSIEAKKLDIKTGINVREAKKICPEIILVENNPLKYLATTKKIFKILKTYTDDFEAYSIDEGFLNLNGWIQTFDQAKNLAITIRQRIKDEVGEYLRCSIGIGQTRFMAKLASDIASADETLVLNQANLDEFLSKVKLTDIWGIGKQIKQRLNDLNIFTPLELKYYSLENIMTCLGIYGYQLWANLNGLEIDSGEIEEAQPKSIGHSYCIPNQTTDLDYLEKILYKLCQKTGRRLRSQGLEAKRAYFSYYCLDGSNFGKQNKLLQPINSTWEIFLIAQKILQQNRPPTKVRQLAVGVSSLNPISSQMQLWTAKNKPLQKTLDSINDRYGEEVLTFGKMFNLKSQAKFRIGFRKTVGRDFD